MDQEEESFAEEELHRQIEYRNFKIREINTRHAEPNLRLDSHVSRSRKRKHNRHVCIKHINLKLYTDGIHPGPLLSHAWNKIIISDLIRVQEAAEVPSVEEADQQVDERIVVRYYRINPSMRKIFWT